MLLYDYLKITTALSQDTDFQLRTHETPLGGRALSRHFGSVAEK